MGRTVCDICGGDGELPIGSKAAHEGRPDRLAIPMGWFRELGFHGLWSLEDAKGRRNAAHTAEAVRYLRGGTVLLPSARVAHDIFDPKVVAGTRTLLTDDFFVWPDALAYYVENYGVELDASFEGRMARADWHAPKDLDTRGSASKALTI